MEVRRTEGARRKAVAHYVHYPRLGGVARDHRLRDARVHLALHELELAFTVDVHHFLRRIRENIKRHEERDCGGADLRHTASVVDLLVLNRSSAAPNIPFGM